MRSAFVVEDEYDAQQLVVRALTLAGYSNIVAVRSRQEALEFGVEGLDRHDLFIIDRNIPDLVDDRQSSSDVGDLLLSELLDLVPDRPFIVYTGWDDSPLYRTALDLAAKIVVTNGDGTVSRLHVLPKGEGLELRNRAEQVRVLLDALDAIEIEGGASLDLHGSRLFRKLAAQTGGTRIEVSRLGGGRSGAGVWRCRVLDQMGRVLGNFVVKETMNLKSVGTNDFVGIQTVAPGTMVAGFLMQVSGLCGRRALDVFQAAGESSVPIWDLVGSEQSNLDTAILELVRGLSGARPVVTTSILLSDSVGAFLPWDEASALMTKFLGGTLDPQILVASILEPQHGDLHGGNVLVDNSAIALIDFDRGRIASRIVDPVTFLLSWFLHPEGPWYGSSSPSPDGLIRVANGDLVPGLPSAPAVASLQTWVDEASAGGRDRWAAVLGYSLRQMRYFDEETPPGHRERVIALARAARDQLQR